MPLEREAMKIVNLTPHTVNLDGKEYPSEGIARVSMETRAIPVEGLPVPAVMQVPGEVIGLPAPAEGVVVIVSAMVANAVMRVDVCHPAELIRDDGGRILGAAALSFPAWK
jgi:hypothetical protein